MIGWILLFFFFFSLRNDDSVYGTEEGAYRSINDIVVDAGAPYNVAVWKLDSYISTSLGIGSDLKSVFFVCNNGEVKFTVAFDGIADCIQTTVSFSMVYFMNAVTH